MELFFKLVINYLQRERKAELMHQNTNTKLIQKHLMTIVQQRWYAVSVTIVQQR